MLFSATSAPQKAHSNQKKECVEFPSSISIANRDEITSVKLKIEGEMPADLRGHIFILGPAGAVDSTSVKGNQSLVVPAHNNGISIFNGDGIICRLDFEEGANVLATTRLVKTPCFFLDKAVHEYEKSLKEFRFQSVGLMRFSPHLGMRTQGNTACLPIQFLEDTNPRIFLTSDAGRPYEIDPVTLEVITPLGWNKEWKEIKMPIATGPFKMVGSAAHPGFDEKTQEFFTVNWSKSMDSMLAPIGLCTQRLESLLENLPSFIQRKRQKIKLMKLVHNFPILGDLIYLLQDELLPEGELSSFFEPYVSPDLLIAIQEIEREISLKPIQSIDNLLTTIYSLLEEASSVFTKTKEMEDFVYLIRWDGKDVLQSWKVLVDNGEGSEPVRLENSLHQIGITEDYIVLMDTSFKVGINQVFGKSFPGWERLLKILRDRISHVQSSTSHVYIIRRTDLIDSQREDDKNENTIVAKRISLPHETAHFAVDYVNPNNKITLHVAHNCAWDPAEWVQPYDETFNEDFSPLVGFSVGAMDLNKLGKYVLSIEENSIQESQIISDQNLTWATAIFTHSPFLNDGKIDNIFWNSWGLWEELKTRFAIKLYQDYPLRDVPTSEVLSKTLPSNIIRLNTESMAIEDYYQFPDGYFGNSPQFVPREGESSSTTDGYITSIVVNNQNQSFSGIEIWIFDASRLSEGPVCKLSHPLLNLGVTIHSAWVPTIHKRQAEYLIPIREDYFSILDKETPVIRQLFEKYVFPNFK